MAELTIFFFFQAEVIFLGQLRHPHLVKLIGYCCEDEHRLLVYEYMARGNLENHLFKSEFCSAIPYLSLFSTLSIICFPVDLTLRLVQHKQNSEALDALKTHHANTSPIPTTWMVGPIEEDPCLGFLFFFMIKCSVYPYHLSDGCLWEERLEEKRWRLWFNKKMEFVKIIHNFNNLSVWKAHKKDCSLTQLK